MWPNPQETGSDISFSKGQLLMNEWSASICDISPTKQFMDSQEASKMSVNNRKK